MTEQERKGKWIEFFTDSLNETCTNFKLIHLTKEFSEEYFKANNLDMTLTSEKQFSIIDKVFDDVYAVMQKNSVIFTKFIGKGKAYGMDEYIGGVEECHNIGKGIHEFAVEKGSIEYTTEELKEFYKAVVPNLELFFSFVKMDITIRRVIRDEDKNVIRRVTI